jgi:PAS domain S-box-containing protein
MTHSASGSGDRKPGEPAGTPAPLFSLALELATADSEPKILEATVQFVRTRLGAGRCSILEVDADAGTARVEASSAPIPGRAIELRRHPELLLLPREGDLLAITDPSSDQRLGASRELLARRGVAAILVARLGPDRPGTRPRVVRALWFDSAPAPSTGPELVLACRISGLEAAAARRRSELELRVRALDSRTGEEIGRREALARLEEALDHFSSAFRVTADLVVQVDVGGRIVHANDRVLAETGWTREELTGRTTEEFVSPEDVPETRERLSRLFAGEVLPPRRVTVLARSGEQIPLELVSRVLADAEGRPTGLEIVGRRLDPSGNRDSQFAGVLSTEVDALRRIEEALRRSDRLRSLLVSNTAHALRTPITVLKAWLETLLSDLSDGLGQEQRSAIEICSEATDRLERIVEELVDLAALESGDLRLDRRPIPVAPLLRRIESTLSPLAGRREVALKVRCAPEIEVLGDAGRVEQILVSLVESAVERSPKGGRVDLAVSPAGSALLFAVQDRGPAVVASELDALFEEFYRGRRGTSRGKARSELALALARRLAEALGGVLAAGIPDGGGLEFRLSLPDATPASALPCDRRPR